MRKGYLYTLDAGIAVIILVVGFMIIAALYLYTPDKERTEAMGNDISGLLAQVTLDDICTDIEICDCSSYPSVELLCLQGKIRNRHATMMELFGQLYHDNERPAIRDILNETIMDNRILPPNFRLQIMLMEPATGKMVQLYPLVIS
jgi:hypothetical protein